ncbi:MAG: PTS sugar transporter subunit IIA [Sulfuricaulis sp.]|nr:PTS sugar transporter subunit IIA [Sulfuricaulis sp.]
MPGKHTLSDPATAVHIREILPPERITLKLTVSGKEDLFGQLSALLSRDVAGLDRRIGQNSLIERERLGSTGIGQGIALPHGRIPGLARCIGAFTTLAHGMEYGAIDRKPVTMAFALLVPDNAAEEHLLILSRLAGIFRDHETRQELLAAQTTEEICQCFARAENRCAR